MCTSVRSQENDTCKSMFGIIRMMFKDFLVCVIIKLHMIFDCLVDSLFGFYYNGRTKKIPSITNDLLLMSASELAEKIRTKKVSSVAVVTAFTDRAKEINSVINAVVEDRYINALEEAKKVDILIQKCENIDVIKEKKPFLGVPFTTKESIEAKGMLHTMGLINRRDFRSQEDATVVNFVKSAGGILIAKTNIPELNLWTESRNNLYGQTCNPYNTTRNVGGSSGGEGAIIAACGAAVSIGSDIGGSTRMPAFFNGVFGHKPTEGLTPLKGVGLRQTDYPNSMAESGPICKKAEDLIPFLKVLVGEKISLLKLDTVVDLKYLKIFYQESSGDLRASKINSEMKTALLKAVQHFQDITGSATKVKIPGSQYSYRLWRFWMSQENFDFKSSITNGKFRANAITEISKLLTGNSELTLAAIIKLIDEDLLPKENAEWALNITANMKKYLMDKLENNGVLFYPSSPFPASYHYTAYLRPFNFGYWCLFNVLRFPVCQVPLGLDKNGLPVGVQALWDQSSKHYHNRDTAQRLWDEVAKELNVPLEVAKKKWKGLRDTYQREYNKMKLKIRSGAPGGVKKSSTWTYFKCLSFLKEVTAPRLSTGNIPAPPTSPETLIIPQADETDDLNLCSDFENECFPHTNAHTLQTSQLHIDIDNHAEDTHTHTHAHTSQSTTHHETTTLRPSKRKRSHNNTIQDKLLHLEEEKLNLMKNKQQDSNYHFLMSLLPHFKKIPDDRVLITQMKLQQVLLDELTTTSTEHTTHTSHHDTSAESHTDVNNDTL